jgi:hypothetical protein
MAVPKKIQRRDAVAHTSLRKLHGLCQRVPRLVRDPTSHQVGNDSGRPRPQHHHHPGQDRNLWRAIHNSNKTNGLVVATHVCLPLRRSSLAGLVPPSIFSCFSAFLSFFIYLFNPNSDHVTRLVIVSSQSISSTRGGRRYSRFLA